MSSNRNIVTVNANGKPGRPGLGEDGGNATPLTISLSSREIQAVSLGSHETQTVSLVRSNG